MAEKTAAAAAAGAAAEEIADCDEQCYVDEEINEQMEDLILYPEESCPSFEVILAAIFTFVPPCPEKPSCHS